MVFSAPVSLFYEQFKSRGQPDPAPFLKFDRVGDQPVTGHSSSKKIKDHDVRVLIFGMSREVATKPRTPAHRAEPRVGPKPRARELRALDLDQTSRAPSLRGASRE